MAKSYNTQVKLEGFDEPLSVDCTWYEDERDLVINEVRCPDNGPNILDILSEKVVDQIGQHCIEDVYN